MTSDALVTWYPYLLLLFALNVIMTVTIIVQYASILYQRKRLLTLFRSYLNFTSLANEMIDQNTIALHGPQGSPGTNGSNGANGANGTISGFTTDTQLFTSQVVDESTGTVVATGTWRLVKLNQTVVSQQIGLLDTFFATSSLLDTNTPTPSNYQPESSNTLFAVPMNIVVALVGNNIGNMTVSNNYEWQFNDGSTSFIIGAYAASVVWIGPLNT
jgi:hypothetical protein